MKANAIIRKPGVSSPISTLAALRSKLNRVRMLPGFESLFTSLGIVLAKRRPYYRPDIYTAAGACRGNCSGCCFAKNLHAICNKFLSGLPSGMRASIECLCVEVR
jgi:hypothetical protein